MRTIARSSSANRFDQKCFAIPGFPLIQVDVPRMAKDFQHGPPVTVFDCIEQRTSRGHAFINVLGNRPCVQHKAAGTE